MLNALGKMARVGGWAPIFVFALHVFISGVLRLYRIWPQVDIPMHFLGGVAIAFFVSGCFRALPHQLVQGNRVALLELLLTISMAATAAVLWEFWEFTFDQIFGTNVQVSLANTMQDLAMGITGAVVFGIIRSRQLQVGIREVREIAGEWVGGGIAR